MQMSAELQVPSVLPSRRRGYTRLLDKRLRGTQSGFGSCRDITHSLSWWKSKPSHYTDRAIPAHAEHSVNPSIRSPNDARLKLRTDVVFLHVAGCQTFVLGTSHICQGSVGKVLIAVLTLKELLRLRTNSSACSSQMSTSTCDDIN
jgi:hypothetical protein